ncbi:unnamed protein product, partial [Prorocentrum cordatum]
PRHGLREQQELLDHQQGVHPREGVQPSEGPRQPRVRVSRGDARGLAGPTAQDAGAEGPRRRRGGGRRRSGELGLL